MKTLTALTVALAPLAAIAYSAGAFMDSTPPTMGTIELKGGTEKKLISTASITPGAGPEIIGTLVNKTGAAIDDMTIEVHKKAPATTPPTGGSETSAFKRGGKTDANASDDSGGFVKSHADFDGGAGMDPVPKNGDFEVEVGLTTKGDGTEIEVWLTPSRKVGTTHADVLQFVGLSGVSSTGVTTLSGPHNASGILTITNVDRSSLNITALTGSVTGVTLLSVALQEVGNTGIDGATVTVSGNTFAISGFPAMFPAESYELLCNFTAAPTAPYTVSLTATFSE